MQGGQRSKWSTVYGKASKGAQAVHCKLGVHNRLSRVLRAAHLAMRSIAARYLQADGSKGDKVSGDATHQTGEHIMKTVMPRMLICLCVFLAGSARSTEAVITGAATARDGVDITTKPRAVAHRRSRPWLEL